MTEHFGPVCTKLLQQLRKPERWTYCPSDGTLNHQQNTVMLRIDFPSCQVLVNHEPIFHDEENKIIFKEVIDLIEKLK